MFINNNKNNNNMIIMHLFLQHSITYIHTVIMLINIMLLEKRGMLKNKPIFAYPWPCTLFLFYYIVYYS